ncbi:MAG TPA: tetratricopeptide repeat protein [Candidatus Cybelea sp.]
MHRVLCCALSLGALLVSTAAVAAADTTPPEVAQAERLYSDGKFKESLAILNAYLKDHPRDATALADRGDDYEALDDQRSAIADYTAALAINPDYAYALASRCESYREIDHSQEALKDCDAAINLNPKLAYAYRERALLKVGSDVQAALADADRSVSLAPNNAFGLAVRCRIYVEMQSYSEALTNCNSAIALDPSEQYAYFQRGRIEIAQSQWNAAVADFEKTLQLDSSQTGSYYWLGIAQLNLGAYPAALAQADRYITNNVDDPDGHLLRAQIEVKLGNTAEARTSATNALRHYRIVNDESGAAKAQALLDSLGASSTPAP